jgi:hypothetical protein
MVESTGSGKADKTEWRFVEDNLISNVLTSVQKLRQEGRSTNKLDELGEILSELKKTFIEGGGTMVFENFEKTSRKAGCTLHGLRTEIKQVYRTCEA